MTRSGRERGATWRGRGIFLSLFLLAAAPMHAAKKGGDLALPHWDEGEAGGRQESAFPLGNGLWPSDDETGNFGRSRIDPRLLLPPVLPDPASRSAAEAVGRIDKPADARPEFGAKEGERALPEERLVLDWDDYYELIPREYVIDPRFLLEPTRRSALEVFLAGHARSGGVPIFILLFERGQRLPESLRLPELARRWFGEAPVVLAAYFLNEPHRLTLAFGGELGAFADSRREWVRQTCVEEARAGVGAFGQLQRTCRELSVRLYWLQQDLTAWRLDRAARGGRALPRAAPMPAAPLSGPWGASEAPADRDVLFDARQPVARGLWALLGGSVALGMGLAGAAAWKNLARPRPRLFPDLEPSPRLGAPHCGSFSAVVRFAPEPAARRGRLLESEPY